MRKRTHKFSIVLGLAVIAMLTVLAFAYKRGQQKQPEPEEPAKEVAVADVPLLTLYYKEQPLNQLHGYAQKMELGTLELPLTPLGTEETSLLIDIGETGKDFVSAEYTVYQDGGVSLVEKRQAKWPKKEGAIRTLTLDLSRAVEHEVEYLLEICLQTSSEQQYYYYTRIETTQQKHLAAGLRFVTDFCENSFDKNANSKIVDYLEPDETSDRTSLQSVDLHSSYEMVTWGQLKPSLCSPPVPRLLELSGEQALCSLDYQIQVPEDDETNSYYVVHEYYRVKMTASRMYLLDFEREMTQVFLDTVHSFDGSNIMLGIREEEVDYACSSDGSVVCFEQAGELWLYKTEENSLYKIYALQDGRREDIRSFLPGYDIHILNMDEKGTVDFTVSGYFNRGSYEGFTGIQLCRYDSKTESYDIVCTVLDTRDEALVRRDAKTFVYGNETDLYYYLQGALCHVAFADGKEERLAENLDRSWVTASSDGCCVSWIEEDAASVIQQRDLKTNRASTVSVGKEEYVRPIGYVSEDFVYGKGTRMQAAAGKTGIMWYPMHTVVICNAEGETIKEYTDETQLVIGGSTNDAMISLDRVYPTIDGNYIWSSSHQIVSSREKEKQAVTIESVSNEKRKRQYVLQLSQAHSVSGIHLYFAKEGGEKLTVTRKYKLREEYFVLVNGRLSESFTNSREAFVFAEEQRGMVKNARQQVLYVYEQAASDYNGIQQNGIDSAILQAPEGIVAAWRSQMPDHVVVDASGLSLSAVCSLVQNGWTALLQTGAGDYRSPVAWKEGEMTVCNPVNGEEAVLSRADIEALYRQCGSVCVIAR